jgi:hypothetical protein
MDRCVFYSCLLIIFTIVGVIFLRCESVESYLFRCSECDTNCTSDNIMWMFLIISLPVVLILQWLMDNRDRQNRIVYDTPVPTLPSMANLDILTRLIVLHKEGELTDSEFKKSKQQFIHSF